MAFLKVSGLTKHYGEGGANVQVLRGIDLALEQGEICALLGPSGSGKSTFLNIVGGLEKADAGTITVGKTELTNLNDHDVGEYRRNTLGFVFQFYNLVEDLTMRENIEVCQYLSPNPLSVDDLLKSLGIWAQRNSFPNEVSGGGSSSVVPSVAPWQRSHSCCSATSLPAHSITRLPKRSLLSSKR